MEGIWEEVLVDNISDNLLPQFVIQEECEARSELSASGSCHQAVLSKYPSRPRRKINPSLRVLESQQSKSLLKKSFLVPEYRPPKATLQKDSASLSPNLSTSATRQPLNVKPSPQKNSPPVHLKVPPSQEPCPLLSNQENQPPCFVCCGKILQEFRVILKSSASKTKTPYAECIGDIVGDDCVIVFSIMDKICIECYKLLEAREELRHQLGDIDQKLGKLLRAKYSIQDGTNINKGECSKQEATSKGRAKKTPMAIMLKQCSIPPRAHLKRSVRSSKSTISNAVRSKVKVQPESSASTSQVAFVPLVPSGCRFASVVKVSNDEGESKQFYFCNKCKFSTLLASDMEHHNCVPPNLNSQFSDMTGSNISDIQLEKYKCDLCEVIVNGHFSIESHMAVYHKGVKGTYQKIDKLSNVNKVESCNEKFISKSKESSVSYIIFNHLNRDNTNNKNDNEILQCKLDLHDNNTTQTLQSNENIITINQSEEVLTNIASPSTSINVSRDNVIVNNQKFACIVCKSEFVSNEVLENHQITHKKFNCSHCQLILTDVNNYKRHLMYHTKRDEILNCIECGQLLPDTSDLCSHMVATHNCFFQCKFCSEQFATETNMKEHLALHEETILSRKCQLCEKVYENERNCKKHVMMNHTEVKCNSCEAVLIGLVNLRKHKKIHNKKTLEHIINKNHEGNEMNLLNNMSLPCTVCNKILKSKQGLEIHMYKHTGNYKFRCEICDKGCVSKHSYDEHVNNHSSNPKILYTCDKCGQTFRHYGSFKMHMNWHKNPYPASCNYCGLKLRHKISLRDHILREHTHEKPFKCSHCDKCFINNVNLQKHLSVHTGKYIYHCKDCNKGFNNKNAHNTHRHNHHDGPSPIKKTKTKLDYKVIVPDGPSAIMEPQEESFDEGSSQNEIIDAVDSQNAVNPIIVDKVDSQNAVNSIIVDAIDSTMNVDEVNSIIVDAVESFSEYY